MFFLFVNYIYLIYFTVFNLINHKLLQNFAHVPCILQHFTAISNVAWNPNVLGGIQVVLSSPTYNISMVIGVFHVLWAASMSYRRIPS